MLQKRIGLLLVSLHVFLVACQVSQQPVNQAATVAQNLVVLCLDTLRTDHLGSYGYQRDTSPHIDQIAAEGTQFDLSISQSNWTVPAVGSLMTSLYPHEHGAGLTGDNRHLGESKIQQMGSQVRTLAESLRGSGFRTALLSANPYLFGRFKSGFEFAEVNRVDATRLTDTAISWLSGLESERFFLYVQYMDLHQPIKPPQPYYGYFGLNQKGETSDEYSGWRFGRLEDEVSPEFQRFKSHKIELYDGALRYVDSEIGRLVKALGSAGLKDSTLIVVTSDHGEEFWEHAMVERETGFDPRDIWGIGHGHSMFQELVRVPLIFHGPEVAGGRRLGCPSRLVDVVPTVLDILQLDPMPGIRGRSLKALLSPRATDVNCQPQPLLSESPAYGLDTVSVVLGKYKLIRRVDGLELLFDLERDPEEKIDLAAQYPEVVARLEAAIDQEMAASLKRGDSAEMEFDPETLEQLRTLGYID